MFQEEAYSIALHPSGLYILVGFSDKLRLMNILIDDIRIFKEFTIRGCREVNSGRVFFVLFMIITVILMYFMMPCLLFLLSLILLYFFRSEHLHNALYMND